MQNDYKNPTFNFEKLPSEFRFKRFELVSELISINPSFSLIGEYKDIYFNIKKYSNEFLAEMAVEFKYLDGKFDGKPDLKKKYEDLTYEINKEYTKLSQEYIIAQEAQAEQNQINYSPEQQYHQQLYYAQQLQYSQGQPEQYQGQNYSQQDQNYNKQIYNQQQGQNYNYNQQQSSRFDKKGQNNSHYPRDTNQRDQNSNNYTDTKYERKEKKFHEKPPQQQYEKKPEEVRPEPQPKVVVPPPKPQPKPTKFTISQIKELINAHTKEELEKIVNPEVLAKATEISQWKTQEIEVKMKEDPIKFTKKDSNNRRDDGRDNKGGYNSIKTGVRKDEAKEAEKLGYKGVEEKKVQIVVGAKDTIEARQMKVELKNKAFDFVQKRMEEDKNLDSTQLARKEIVYNLNLIVPENLRDIEKDLFTHLYQSELICKVLIEEIIKKAWDQPKYASTYAKLCQDFCKKMPSEFKFEGGKKEKENPFKYLLIDRVQHSFDEKIEEFPEFKTPEDKELFLKGTKKQILSNVKFIAELIVCKILRKMIIKYCISKFFQSFLNHYYAFMHNEKIEDSIYDYHYEAIIEFIENIGEKYESIDEKDVKGTNNYSEIRGHIEGILKLTNSPNLDTLFKLESLTGDEYFQLLKRIDSTFIKAKFPRLSALLQNLIERRENGWQKHLSAADGPKKLKDIQDDQNGDEMSGKAQPKVNKQKQDQQRLDKKVKELYEGWQMDKKEEEREIREITKKHSDRAFYLTLLKQVSDQKKVLVQKRIELFTVLVKGDRFSLKDFKNAWIDGIKYLANVSGDFPFCGAALAKILMIVPEKQGQLPDYCQKLEDEDEQFFMEEVVQKYYFYSNDEVALNHMGKPKPKHLGMI